GPGGGSPLVQGRKTSAVADCDGSGLGRGLAMAGEADLVRASHAEPWRGTSARTGAPDRLLAHFSSKHLEYTNVPLTLTRSALHLPPRLRPRLIQSPRSTPATMATSANPTSARPTPTRSVMARSRTRSTLPAAPDLGATSQPAI